MNLLQPYLSDALVQALGWTFLHSLWIGALLTVVFLGVRWILKHQSAQVKYTVGLVFLVLLPLSVAFVFYFSFTEIQLTQKKQLSAYVGELATEPVNTAFTTEPATEESRAFYTQWASAIKHYYFQQYHSFFVGLWMLGVLMLSVRNVGGYLYAGRLRKVGLFEPEDQLRQAFSSLLERSGITRTVTLMESVLVKSPLLIGYLKPVILFPIGMATHLSIWEVEAILAHEIAHIRRHDFLVNILQCCVEVLFFYHPGVWIIGSIIRTERENCCDDLAIGLSGDRVSLALALTHVEEWKLQNSFALGFSGNKNSLLNRIKRIINNKAMKAQNREGNLLAVAIIAGLCLSTLTALKGIDYEIIQTEKAEATRQVKPDTAVAVEKAEPPAGTKAATPVAKPAAKPVANANPAVAKPAIAGSALATASATPAIAPMPVRDFASNERSGQGMPPLPPAGAVLSADAPTAFAMAPMPVWASGFTPSTDMWLAGKDTLDRDAPVAETPEDFARHMNALASEMARMQEHMAHEMAERALEMSKAASHLAGHQQEMASEMARHQQEMAEEMALKHREMAERHAEMAIEFSKKHQEEMMKHREEMLKEQQQMMAMHEGEMKKMEEEMRKHEEKMNAFEKDLKSELLKDGLISSKDNRLQLKINGKELTVNGEKQNVEVYNKYRKFIKDRLGESYSFEADGDEEMNLSFSF